MWSFPGFYTLNLLPLVVLITYADTLSSSVFISLFLGYCLVYRPLSSSFRLLHLRLIDKSQVWKPFIPLWDKQFFKPLTWASCMRKKLRVTAHFPTDKLDNHSVFPSCLPGSPIGFHCCPIRIGVGIQDHLDIFGIPPTHGRYHGQTQLSRFAENQLIAFGASGHR